MDNNFTARAYYVFMFMLPLLFFPGIADLVLLPRQVFLTAFTALLFIFIWKTSKADAYQIKLSAAPLAIIAFLIIGVIVSFTNSIVISESLYFLSKFWILTCLCFLTIWLLNNNAITTNQIIKAVIIFGCAAVLTGVADIANKTVQGEHLFRSVHSITGSFSNKNLLSSVLFLCLPFFMIGCRGKKLLKLISYLALFLALLVLVILRTRTALGATLVFFGIISLFLLHEVLKRKIWVVILFLVGISTFVFWKLRLDLVIDGLKSSPDIRTQYFFRIFDLGTFRQRMLFWKNSIDMFLEHPFGVGLGNWQIHFPKYGLEKFNSVRIENGLHTLQRPHNDFLWILCETGVFGLAAFATILIIILSRSYSLIKTAKDRYHRLLFIYLFSAVIGFIVIAFFDFPMERIEHQVILMLLFAIVIYQHQNQNSGSFAFPIKKILIMLFVVFGIGASFMVAFPRLQSERHVAKLEEARKLGNADNIIQFAKTAEKGVYKIDTKTIPLKWYLGTAYFSQKRLAESEASFQEAYSLTPYNIHVINNLATCYELNGKREDAIEMYSKALRISPKFEEARLNLAAIFYNNKDYDSAYTTIDGAYGANSDPRYLIFLRAILKAKFDMVIACVDFKYPEAIRKKLDDPHYYLQIYYESRKNNVTFEKQTINELKKNL